MSRRMKYYAVCYGHVCRFEKASSGAEAARLAYGMVDVTRMTVQEVGGSPRYMSQKKRKEFLEVIAARHKAKTGEVIK